MMIFAILAVIWWIVGCAGFAFWWTTDDDLDVPTAIMGIYIGLVGPFTWILGGFIHGHWWGRMRSKVNFGHRVIIKRRK